MRALRFVLPLLLAGACRIGGPSGDPAAYVTFPSDAADVSDGSSAPESGGDDASGANAGPDATSGADASADSTSPLADAGGGDGGDAACTPPANVATCNPVTNTGCTLLQCDIDTTQMTPTGTCVAASPFPNGPGSSCTQVSGSVSCQPQYTCYAGTCKKVCFCNSDCSSNECCGGSAGTTGFGLCGVCH